MNRYKIKRANGPRKRPWKAKGVDLDWVSQLPGNILYDILSRTPTGTIFSCMCVSNTFLKIITSSYFDSIRNSRLPDRNSCLVIQKTRAGPNLSILYIADLENSRDCDYCPMQLTSKPSTPEFDKNVNCLLVGSVNGLLCLRYLTNPHSHIFYICNPILGEYMRLPHPTTLGHESYAVFGFCPKTKKYKVMRFMRFLGNNRNHILIHIVGTNFWTTIQSVPFPGSYHGLASCSLNGIIHWITDSKRASSLICAINLETDGWEYISPPPQIDQDTCRYIGIAVGALSGLFCVFYQRYDNRILEVCVMKEYGVKESWSREISIDVKSTFGFDPRKMFAYQLRVLNNGHLLLTYGYRSIVYYDPQKGTRIDIAPGESYNCIPHVSSFISLKDIMGVENVEVWTREKIRVN